MKICNSKREKGLRYDDLKQGDIFGWKDTYEGSPHCYIKCGKKGYTKLASSQSYPSVGKYKERTDYSTNGKVLRFPNACIDLGEPE